MSNIRCLVNYINNKDEINILRFVIFQVSGKDKVLNEYLQLFPTTLKVMTILDLKEELKQLGRIIIKINL